MPVGLHSGRVWRNSMFSLFPSLVDIYAELLLKALNFACPEQAFLFDKFKFRFNVHHIDIFEEFQ